MMLSSRIRATLFFASLGALFACSTDAEGPVHDGGVDTDAQLEVTDGGEEQPDSDVSDTGNGEVSDTDDSDGDSADTDEDSESVDADAQPGDVDDSADVGPDSEPEDAASGDVVDDPVDDDTAINDAASPDGDATSDVSPGGDGSAALSRAARAVCGALSRCCSPDDIETYFGAYALDTRFDALGDVFPPDVEQCAATLEDAWRIAPFGPWFDALDAGLIELNSEGLGACIEELNEAPCGAGAWDALLDSTCFALSAPLGGDAQRRAFRRSAEPATPCESLNDGFGGLWYGTCDPTQAFCCVRDGFDCVPPTEAGAIGVCATAATLGEPCGIDPLKPCVTGLVCGPEGTCEENVEATLLSPGATCATDGFILLGTCVGSYCDLFGARVCVPKKTNGESCLLPEECISGQCDAGACAPFTTCDGA